MSNFVIQAEGLAKQYRIGAQQASYKRFTEEVMSTLTAPLRRLKHWGEPQVARRTIWALQDVSFEAKQGEVIGVIGRNGAGKSTLLKILSRITEPTQGRVIIRGHVGSLLEVGTGFHPELTGRENIFLNGAIMGMRRADIRRKFDEIVAFAGVEQFIDTPVKRYSSGMYVRLAFAVAAHMEPEILLVDEVLAVGDAAFQKKSLGKMGDVAKEGRTVLLVSHNMGSIRQLCSRCLWIDEGRVRVDGPTGQVVDAYLTWSDVILAKASSTYEDDPTREAQLRAARLLNQKGEEAQNFSCDEPVIVELTYQVNQQVGGIYAVFQITRIDGITVLVSYSYDMTPDPLDNGLPVGAYLIHVTIPSRTLAAGTYMVQFSVGRGLLSTAVVDDPGTICTFTLDDFTSRKGNTRIGYFSTLLPWDVKGEKRDS